jgi:hypothetical protein
MVGSNPKVRVADKPSEILVRHFLKRNKMAIRNGLPALCAGIYRRLGVHLRWNSA